MIRNLKVLGLALVAMFAMSAVVASAASAQGVITPETGDEVTLTAEDTGENALTVGAASVTCPESTYTGHKTLTTAETEESKSHEFLPKGATSVTVTPHYKQVAGETANCDATGGLSSTVTMNGCDYDFYDFTTIEGEHEYSFTTDLVCPSGKNVEVHVYSGHGHGFQVCKDVVTPGTEFTGGRAVNQAGANGLEHHVKLTGTVHGFEVHQSGLCGTSTPEGLYHLNVTVWGHNADEEDIGVTISD